MIIKLKKQILEAIDQLRGRKARPDIERICNHVQRRYNIEPQETLADLERLVDEEQVIRVEYKGSTSYRNVAKWPRFRVYKNKPRSIATSNSERTSSMLQDALKVLASQKAIYKISGIPYDEIQKYILINSEDESRFKDKNQLDTVLALEMNAGNIVMLENGNYVLESQNIDLEDVKLKLENLSANSSPPKKLMNPWTLDIKEENDETINTESPPLSPKTQRMYDVLKICKTLHDAEKKVSSKRKKEDNKNIRNNSDAAPATTPSESEGASLAPDKTATPAMRVGSRRKVGIIEPLFNHFA